VDIWQRYPHKRRFLKFKKKGKQEFIGIGNGSQENLVIIEEIRGSPPQKIIFNKSV
jgi:hypothetical protein